MSDRVTTILRQVPAHDAKRARRGLRLQRLGLGSAVLATLVLAPSTATAAVNSPIVIDFDQSRLILGWASLWIVTVFALLACGPGGRAMIRNAGHALPLWIRHQLQLWRNTLQEAGTGRTRGAAATSFRSQATTGRIAAAQIAAVLAESRSRQSNHDLQVACPAAHRQASGRTYWSTPMTGLPTHHHTVAG